MQKYYLTFLTHNNATVGFTSQSLGLPAYVCKTQFYCNKISSQNAPKLAIWSSKN